MNKSRFWLAAGFVLLLAGGAAVAQEQDPGTSTSGQQPAPQAAETQEAPKAAEGPSGFFGESFGSRLSWGGEVTFRQSYDDNVFSSSLFRFSDNISQFSGRLTAGIDGKRTKFQFHYSPNYRLYYKFDDRNQFSQQFASSLSHRFSAFTTFNWDATLSDSSTTAGSPFGFVLVGPVIIPIYNPDAMQNNARIIAGRTSFGLEHRLSARSSVHATIRGGATAFLSKNGVPLLPGRARQQYSMGGSVGWNYEFRPGRKIGVELGESYFGFLDPSRHLNYQTAKVRYKQSFRNGFELNLGAGPSFSESQASGNNVDVNYAIDASLIKALKRSRVGASFSREVRQSQLQDALSAYSATTFMNQSIGRRWQVGTSVAYSRSEGVAVTGDIESFSAQGQIGYLIRRDLRASLGYSYINQLGGKTLLFGNQFDRNLYSFGLTYSFGASAR